MFGIEEAYANSLLPAVTLYILSVAIYAEESDTANERLRRHASVGLDSHPEALAQWKEGSTNDGEGGTIVSSSG